MYHAITDSPSRAARALSVTPSAFAAQLTALDALGFTPLTAGELGTAWRERRPLPRRPVLITFDDGYEGVHRHALPSLAHHGFRATLFVATGWLPGPEATGGAPDTMLDWDQVRALAAAGCEIGGHSHTHPALDQLAGEPLSGELTRCRDLLTEQTGRCPRSFAYPYGYSSRRVRRAVREAGFRQALAVGNAWAARAQGPYALTRLTVRRSTSPEEFLRMVEGRALRRTFAVDHALTKGYAVVRRTRRAALLPVTARAQRRGGHGGSAPTT
ncbi:polysaccharide deacetylase family protein [Streptomyces sp. AJS327]|uniref:polysaccharide deacetylase family protein n=1 Tax=Streptomyces sp. AJS327 TaxID=2545265 RepID=UPI0015DE257D|nr:polysaccharide deacetylase family protein [Streptomyces sp. AJS327]MBA0050587.1 polysaccharide deacetylase family protein [Streptomyces sp. AJS327]